MLHVPRNREIHYTKNKNHLPINCRILLSCECNQTMHDNLNIVKRRVQCQTHQTTPTLNYSLTAHWIDVSLCD